MESVYFTSFGILMSLLLQQKSPPKKFSISRQIDLIINPNKMEEDEHHDHSVTPDRKKTKKHKKKQGLKYEMHQEEARLYPTSILSSIEYKEEILKKEIYRRLRC